MKKSNERGKSNMKKIVAFLMTAVMLLSLTACGGKKIPKNHLRHLRSPQVKFPHRPRTKSSPL